MAMSDGIAVQLRYPFTGRWLVQNSPANRVPSHGTTLFASSYAIDFVPVDERGHSAPMTARTLFGRESADSFFGFGAPVLAPCAGNIVLVENTLPDHDAHRGVASIGYALTQRQRVAGAWQQLAGNHVMIQGDGPIIALCHLQRNSITVEPGEEVAPGQMVARCGNSGNSTEPHVHVQAIDRLPVHVAKAVPLLFDGQLPHNGQILQVPVTGA